MDSSLKNRLRYGPLLLGGLLALLWVDAAAEGWTAGWFGLADGISGLGLAVMMALVLPPAVAEMAHLLAAQRIVPYRFIAITGSLALVLHALLTQFPWFRPVAASTLAFIIVAVMLLTALRRALLRQTQEALQHMAGTVLATLYLGGLTWFLMALRVKQAGSGHLFEGSTWIIIYILLVVKFTDIGAYFGGRALGRHKLIPWLSPGKTWEGLFCGLLLAGMLGAAMSPLIGPPHFVLQWWKGFLFAVVLGAVGQAGDLLESLMKRDAGVKDSGALVPGFGGILDVIDSPLLAAPFAYLMFSLL
jgi:phosphatidate cytidylyltransferase